MTIDRTTELNEAPAKRKPGRPRIADEVFETILERISCGESLVSICKDKAAGMPDYSTVLAKLANDKEYSLKYTRARECQADHLFDEILEIADDGVNDSYVNDQGEVKTNHDVIARSRLMVDARKWMAGKLRPKVYGEKVAVDATSSDGSMSPKATIDASKLSQEQIEAFLGARIKSE